MKKNLLTIVLAVMAVLTISSAALAGCCSGKVSSFTSPDYGMGAPSPGFGPRPGASCCPPGGTPSVAPGYAPSQSPRPSSGLPPCCTGANSQPAAPASAARGPVRLPYVQTVATTTNVQKAVYYESRPTEKPSASALRSCCTPGGNTASRPSSGNADSEVVPFLSALLSGSARALRQNDVPVAANAQRIVSAGTPVSLTAVNGWNRTATAATFKSDAAPVVRTAGPASCCVDGAGRVAPTIESPAPRGGCCGGRTQTAAAGCAGACLPR